MKIFHVQNLFSEYRKSTQYKRMCNDLALILIDAEEKGDSWLEEKFNKGVEYILSSSKLIEDYVNKYREDNSPFTNNEKSQYSDEMKIIAIQINEDVSDIMNKERNKAKRTINCNDEIY